VTLASISLNGEPIGRNCNDDGGPSRRRQEHVAEATHHDDFQAGRQPGDARMDTPLTAAMRLIAETKSLELARRIS
jgi:hypothetical protein